MMGLTERQLWVYRAFERGIHETGRAPGYRQVGRQLRLSYGNICDIVARLVERGVLRRTDRGLQLPERRQYFRFDDESKQLVEWRP